MLTIFSHSEHLELIVWVQTWRRSVRIRNLGRDLTNLDEKLRDLIYDSASIGLIGFGFLDLIQ